MEIDESGGGEGRRWGEGKSRGYEQDTYSCCGPPLSLPFCKLEDEEGRDMVVEIAMWRKSRSGLAEWRIDGGSVSRSMGEARAARSLAERGRSDREKVLEGSRD